jgi:recombination protein RecA
MGISKEGDLIDLGVAKGVIQKSGAWFTYGDDRFNGREKFRTALRENSELFKNIEKELKEKLGMIKPENKEPEETKKKK